MLIVNGGLIMNETGPRMIENREFVELEEEDIQRLNRSEAAKFNHNPSIPKVMQEVEAKLGEGGEWSEHWITIDASGRRVYARIYSLDENSIAITADGRIVKENWVVRKS